jgi:hypothetical protein
MPVRADTISLNPIPRVRMRMRIIGDSPLIVHRFDEKARKQILDKQMKKAQQAKPPKDPEGDFNAARYITEDGQDGFPAAGLKRAACNAFRFADGIKKIEIAGALHVEPGHELVPIISDPPLVREDTVKISMGQTDLRFRPEYRNWRMEFEVVYNERAISAEQIVNLFNIAGFGIGIGEWRPERQGQFGMFHVATDGEV